MAHTYSFVWPLRRLLFAISVMTLRSIPYYYSVSILVFVQVSYLLYLSLARPLTSIRAMIFEIGGEIVILIATLLVFVLNTSEQWTPKINWIYISAVWLVGVTHSIVTMCKYFHVDMLAITLVNYHLIIKVKPIFAKKATPVQDLTLTKKNVNKMSVYKVKP